MSRVARTVLLALFVGSALVFQGCETEEINSALPNVSGDFVLTNPPVPAGEGRDEKVRWQTYTGEDFHGGRQTAIKWPNSLYTIFGCTPQNTRCFVDGTEFFFYGIDVYSTGAQMLSYGCATRADTGFPAPFVAVLFKNGKPYAACEFSDPMIDNALQTLPPQITLPAWVMTVTLGISQPPGPGTDGQVLTNPVISEGEGYSQHAYWKVYSETYDGRNLTIRWPTDLYKVYGCRPENTRCEADGTVFTFYQLDTGEDGSNARLSYGTGRMGSSFPPGVVAILYKDNVPFAAFSVENPSASISLRLPPTQQLP